MLGSSLRASLAAPVLFALAACSSTGSMRASGGSGGGSETGGSGGETVDTGGKTGSTTGGSVGTGGAPAADSGQLEPDAATDTGEARHDAGLGADAAAPDRAPDSSPGPDGPPSASYDPCPPKGKACVALPLGDSLTQGAGSSGGGYRRELFRQAVAHGQSVTFVGSAASGPAMLDGVPVPFPRRHEGHGGFTIGNLSDWLTAHNTIATYKPDIVMLEIGTNNGLRHPGANIPAALNALGAIIDQILAADSHLLLIVAQITPSSTAEGIMNVAAYNAGIPAVVAARARPGTHIAVD